MDVGGTSSRVIGQYAWTYSPIRRDAPVVRKVRVELVDDLDNGAADESVSFGLDGKQYSIDLSSKHAKELRAALAKYLAVARVGTGTSAPNSRTRTVRKSDGPSAGDVRDWAKDQGIAVSDRGRIPSDLMVKFQAAKVS